MTPCVHRLLIPLGRFFVSLRYDIKVHANDDIDPRALNDGPVLILPNHPGYIDPVLVMARVPLKPLPRPLVFSGTYRHAFMFPFMKMVSAFEVPWSAKPSREVYRKSLAVLEEAAQALDRGEHVLLYPSGKLQRQGYEAVAAARGAYDLVLRCPEAKVLLVRTRGLWGSRFSCARTGDLPNLTRALLFAMTALAGSLLFWLPKRSVSMTFFEVERAALPLHDKRAFNAFLDAFYNAEGPEPALFVPYHRWRRVRSAGQQSFPDNALAPSVLPEVTCLSGLSLQPAEATHA